VISVVMPVGPKPHHRRWLPEALASIAAQTRPPDCLIVVNDGGSWRDLYAALREHHEIDRVTTWIDGHWTLGPGAGWNQGIGSSPYDLCFMMASDDTLESGCLEACLEEWERRKDPRGYYAVTVRYMNNQEVQTIPCNYAMVHRDGWRRLGGFPPESGSGAMDAAVLSILMGNPDAGTIYRVAEGTPLANMRRHPDSHTLSRGPWWGVINETRDILTKTWKPNE